MIDPEHEAGVCFCHQYTMQPAFCQHQRHRSILSSNCDKDEAHLLLFHALKESERAAAASFNKPNLKNSALLQTSGEEDIFSSSLLCDQHDYDWLMRPPATTLDHQEPHGNGLSPSGSPSVWPCSPKLGSSRSEYLSGRRRLDSQAPGVTLTASTNATSGKSPFSSSSNRNAAAYPYPSLTPACSVTPIPQPAERPSSLSRSGLAAGICSSIQTGRSALPSSHAVGTSARSSTLIKKTATPAHLKSPSSSFGKKIVFVRKDSTLPSKCTSSRHTGSCAMIGRSWQSSGHPAAVVETIQESPPNVCIDRHFSCPKGTVALRTSNVAAAVKPAHSEPGNGGDCNKHLLSPYLTTRGSLSFESRNGHRSPTHNTGKAHDAEKVSVTTNARSGMVGKLMPPRRSLITSHGFGRSLSNNALEMALRHMDIEGSSKSSVQYLKSDPPMPSIYGGKSRTRCSSLSSSIASSSMATSSYASSEHGMSLGMDSPGSSKCCDETSSDISSRASS